MMICEEAVSKALTVVGLLYGPLFARLFEDVEPADAIASLARLIRIEAMVSPTPAVLSAHIALQLALLFDNGGFAELERADEETLAAMQAA